MIFRFDAFALDTDGYVLSKGAELVSLEPQVFSLLHFLLENREKVVTKDELIEQVWEGRIVSDAAISSAINLARRAVDDDGKTQGVIKTFPRRGFRFVAEVKEQDDNDSSVADKPAALSNTRKPSIAVLPFENLSADPDQEYFSDGMAEDLITDLSNISNLYVAARNSSFSFKGQMPYVQEVAEKLGVRFVLEGSVRKMDDRLRINAQLIDAVDGGHLWAERYDGQMDEIFDFQDRIREEIVAALRLKLTPTDQALTERKPTDSAEAYDLFLKGRAEYHRFTPEHLLEAIRCLEKAIGIDPKFADAYSYLSYCHFAGWIYMWPGFDNSLDRANELAEKGVALDGTSTIALTRLAWIQTFMRRYDQAIANLEKAIALAPDNADVNATFGQVLNYWGHPERGLQMMEKAFSIDTVVPPNWEYHVGLSRLILRQYDEAESRFLKTIERAPKYTPGYLLLAVTYAELDRLDDARDAMKTALEISPRHTVKAVAKNYPYRVDEVRDRILDGMRKAGMPEA